MKLHSDTPPANGDKHSSAPFTRIDGNPAAGFILLCDHATNRVPSEFGSLGLPASEFDRHIAYDPGAAAVTRALAERLASPAVMSDFSRLVIDPNRGPDDPTLVMRLSDGAVVPGNAKIGDVERRRRIACFHAPYHAAISAAIEEGIAAGTIPALVSIHSFTPVWRGHTRPWQVGVLWDRDPRLAEPLIAALAMDEALTVGDNEPYSGALEHDTLYRHGTRRGLAHVLIELRQDLIADHAGVEAWALRLAQILLEIGKRDEIHLIRHFGSITGAVDPI